jgi:hypothetical protein
MTIMLGRGTNHITDRVRRKGQQQPSQNVCNRLSVSSMSCCPVHIETPRITKSWRLAKTIARKTLHSEHGMRIQMTIISVPHLPLRGTTRFTDLHCPIDRPSEVIRAYAISGAEHRLYRVL